MQEGNWFNLRLFTIVRALLASGNHVQVTEDSNYRMS